MSTIETFGDRWRTQAPGSSFNDETIPLGSVHNLKKPFLKQSQHLL